jgi:hypothetical protein
VVFVRPVDLIEPLELGADGADAALFLASH